jgi:hypothetical protein
MRKVKTYEDMYNIFGDGKKLRSRDYIVDLCIPEKVNNKGKVIGIDESFSDQVTSYFGDPNLPFDRRYCNRVLKCLHRSLKEYFSSGPFCIDDFNNDKSGVLLKHYDILMEYLESNAEESIYWGSIWYMVRDIVNKFILCLNPYKRYIIEKEEIPNKINSLFSESIGYSDGILEVFKNNPWMHEMRKDDPEVERIFRITFGGDREKLLHMAIVLSRSYSPVIGDYEISLEVVRYLSDLSTYGFFCGHLPREVWLVISKIMQRMIINKYPDSYFKPLV